MEGTLHGHGQGQAAVMRVQQQAAWGQLPTAHQAALPAAVCGGAQTAPLPTLSTRPTRKRGQLHMKPMAIHPPANA